MKNEIKINVFSAEDKDAKNDEVENLIIKLLPYTTFEQLAKLPEIGKISKKIKTKFVTPLNLFLSDYIVTNTGLSIKKGNLKNHHSNNFDLLFL